MKTYDTGEVIYKYDNGNEVREMYFVEWDDGSYKLRFNAKSKEEIQAYIKEELE